MKKFLAMVLSTAILFTMAAEPALATNIHASQEKAVSLVQPVEYQNVVKQIMEAQEETIISQGTGDIHYYWNDNSFVVKDSNGYYFVEINDAFTQFTVNGKEFAITRTINSTNNYGITFPTAWSTLYDTSNTFDVGGLPFSVLGGLIGSAVGALFTREVVGAIVGSVVGALAGMFLNGVFPVDYKITVELLKKYRVFEPGRPTIFEYYEEIGVYGGPSNNLYQDELYYNASTYKEEEWE